jgi:hypothetical protein
MIAFVGPAKAYQHLTDDLRLDNPALVVTLCGYGLADIFEPVVYHHRTGFDRDGGPACAKCADRADDIQNGPVRR